MKKRVGPALIPVGLAAVAAAVMLMAGVRYLAAPVGGPIYTVNEVAEYLHTEPSVWLGKTIRVRGLVSVTRLACVPRGTASSPCTVTYLLTQFPSVGLTDSLTLHPEPDPFLNLLRGLPGSDQLLPHPQSFVGLSILTVKLEPAPTSLLCPQQPCYEALVPDAEPFHLGSGVILRGLAGPGSHKESMAVLQAARGVASGSAIGSQWSGSAHAHYSLTRLAGAWG